MSTQTRTRQKPQVAPTTDSVSTEKVTLTTFLSALTETKKTVEIENANKLSASTASGKTNLNRYPSLKRLPKAECTIKRLVGDKYREILPVGTLVPLLLLPVDKKHKIVVYAVSNATFASAQSIFRLVAPKSTVDGVKKYACPTDSATLASWAAETQTYGLELIVKTFANAEADAQMSFSPPA
jgi:hypothetical protein